MTFFELACESSKVAEVVPRIVGAPDGLWLGFATLAACPSGELFFVDGTVQGYPTARARCAKKLPIALSALRHGGLLLERTFAAKWLADVPSDEATVRPVVVHDERGVVSDGFMLVEVHKAFPLDRDAPGFDAFDPARPHGTHVAKVGAPTWTDARAPRARIFRLLELPEAVFVDAELLAAIEKATKGAVAALGARRRNGGALEPPPWSRAMVPPFEPDAAAGARAAEAFWSLVRGERAAELRDAALANPWYALAVAAAVDAGPADDTRAAAARAPTCAARYAALIDRGPHPTTEGASRTEGIAGAAYAGHVTAQIDDELAARMIATGGYDRASVDRQRSLLAPIRAWQEAKINA